MRSSLSRAAALAAVLVVAVPATAGAAVDEYAAEASTSSVKISVLEEAVGDPLLDLVSTEASAASDPTASASVGIIEVLGTELFSPAEANSDGELVRDPAEGDGCVLPIDAPGLTLSAVCAVASADAGASDDTSANADTDLLQVGVNGSLVSALLTDPLGELLTDLTDDLADGLVADALAQLTAGCNEVLTTAGDELPADAGELLAMEPDEVAAIRDQLIEVDAEGDCTDLLALTLADIAAPLIDLNPLAEALDGVNLIELGVDGAASDIAGDDASLDATATQAFVEVTGPALSFLDDALTAVVQGVIDGVVAEVEDEIEQTYPGPTADDLQAVLDEIPLFGIDEPLLAGTVSGGVATATLDNGAGSITSGGEAPYVELAIAPGIFELLGQDAESGTQRFEAGQSQTIAEGTPLESTISVGALSTTDGVEFEDTGLVGSTATASATTVSLLKIEGAGSIDIALALSEAGVYAASAVTPASAPPVEPLPHTGGGAALAAVVALGAGLALRRRRD